MRIGSHEHKELFCGSFIQSHEPYEPAELPWPELDRRSVELLRSIPVWSMALQVEINAGGMLTDFAATQPDPRIAQALRLQGYEEDRHGRMLMELVTRYGLPAEVEPPQLAPTRRAFIDFGYNECLDSFFGFGVFRIADDVRFMPVALISLFSRVMWEEARHIVFFVNWISYERAIRGYGATALQVLPTAIGYARALKRSLGRAAHTRTQDKGMAAVGDIFCDLKLSTFLRTCLSENERYMARFDSRLVQPRVIPAIAQQLLRVLDAAVFVRDSARSALVQP